MVFFALMAALTHTALVAYARRWGRALLRALPALAGAAGLGALLMQFSVFSYARAQFEPDRFAQAYVDPRDVRMAPAAPRNLVLVYLESMEQTYGDTDVFERDLLASTRGLGGYSFPSFRMAAALVQDQAKEMVGRPVPRIGPKDALAELGCRLQPALGPQRFRALQGLGQQGRRQHAAGRFAARSARHKLRIANRHARSED